MRQYISLVCITWLRLIVGDELGLIKINKIRRDQLLLILDIYVDTDRSIITGDPLHSRALAHSRAPLFTQPCPHCSHSRAPGEQWARLCVFMLQGCVQAARLCRGSPVIINIPASLQLGEEPLAVTKFETMCFIFPLNAGKVLPIILYWFQSQHMEICKIYNRLKSMHTLKVITNNYDSHAIRRSWCLSLNTTTYDFVSAGLAYLLF